MRSCTQPAQRDPPYARWTVFLGREMVAYSRGRRAGIPASLVPQSPHLLGLVFRRRLHKERSVELLLLGCCARLLDLEVYELATGRAANPRITCQYHGRNDSLCISLVPDLVGLRVVRSPPAVGES